MTITLISTGGYFTYAGHVLGECQDLLALMGGAATSNITSGIQFPARSETVDANAISAGLKLTDARNQDNAVVALAAFQGAQQSFFNWASTAIQDALKGMVNLDQSLPELSNIGSQVALNYLLGQMYGSGGIQSPTATIQASTVAVGALTAGTITPQGNPVLVTSAKNVYGQLLQLVFPETITLTCTQDSQGGAAPGNETISFQGFPLSPSPFQSLFPLPTAGSGCAGSFQLVDGSKGNGQTGNMLVNSDFTTFTTTNYPDNWKVVTGTVGTQIVNGTSTNSYSPTVAGVVGGSLGFVGDGSTLTTISQAFGTASSPTIAIGGTPQTLTPDTQYAGNFWGIVPAGVPTAGVLRVSLQDGAGNILNDDMGTANSISFNLHTYGGSGVGNAFVNFPFVFRTPANLTTQTGPFKLFIGLTTALTSAYTFYFDRIGFDGMSYFYPGGPGYVGFSGNARVMNGKVPDSWTIANTNTYGKVAMWFDRVFNMRVNNLQFPYASSSPTVADSVIA